METKTILEVYNDYDSNFAYEDYKENINGLASELDIIIFNKNDEKFDNIISDRQKTKYCTNHKDSYKNSITIDCVGYSQSDWDTYTIYYNDMTNDLKYLCKELKRLFTHKNDYLIKEIELLDSGHSKVINTHSIMINYIEFPTNKDIAETIKHYGIGDFDEIIFNNN